jgi:hypothetical protein
MLKSHDNQHFEISLCSKIAITLHSSIFLEQIFKNIKIIIAVYYR